MRHCATLLCATLTASLVLVALGAAFADPFEGAPPAPLPPTGADPGATDLPGGVTTVPKNVPGAPAPPAVREVLAAARRLAETFNEGAPRWVSMPDDLKRPPAQVRAQWPASTVGGLSGGTTIVPKIVTTIPVAPSSAAPAPPPTSPSQNSPIKVKLKPEGAVLCAGLQGVRA
jgi:hypothetical protein